MSAQAVTTVQKSLRLEDRFGLVSCSPDCHYSICGLMTQRGLAQGEPTPALSLALQTVLGALLSVTYLFYPGGPATKSGSAHL